MSDDIFFTTIGLSEFELDYDDEIDEVPALKKLVAYLSKKYENIHSYVLPQELGSDNDSSTSDETRYLFQLQDQSRFLLIYRPSDNEDYEDIEFRLTYYHNEGPAIGYGYLTKREALEELALEGKYTLLEIVQELYDKDFIIDSDHDFDINDYDVNDINLMEAGWVDGHTENIK